MRPHSINQHSADAYIRNQIHFVARESELHVEESPLTDRLQNNAQHNITYCWQRKSQREVCSDDRLNISRPHNVLDRRVEKSSTSAGIWAHSIGV